MFVALIGDREEETESDGDHSDANVDDAKSDSNVALHIDTETVDTAGASTDSVDDDVVKRTRQTHSASDSDS